jgi:hypothetical protein
MDGVASFFSNMFSGGTSGGGGGGMGLLSNVGGLVSSGFQAYSAIQSGKLQQKLLELQAEQKMLEARQTEANATFQQNRIKEQLLDDLASSQAFYAGRGFSVGSGSAQGAQIESRKRAAEDYISIAEKRDSATIGIRGQADQLRREGAFAKESGKLKAYEAIPGAFKSFAGLSGNSNPRRRSLLNG